MENWLGNQYLDGSAAFISSIFLRQRSTSLSPPGVVITSPPRAFMIFLRSMLIPSGITIVTLKPRERPTKTQAIPAFPVLDSRISIPGLSSFLPMAAVIIL